MAGGTKQFLANINLLQNQLQNATIQNLAFAPSSPTAGQIYYDTGDQTIYFWDGTSWVDTGSTGTITEVNAVEPLFATESGGIVSLSIQPATSTESGYMSASDKDKLDSATSSNVSDTLIIRDSSGGFSAEDISVNDITSNDITANDITANIISASSATVNQITISNSPTSDTDGVNKLYVDSIAAGLDPKDSVKVVSLSDIVLSGTQSIDGYLLSEGDRVLVNGQSDLTENGIYDVATGTWSRSSDSDGMPNHEVSLGNFTFVEFGDTYAGSGWVLNESNASGATISVGVDEQSWTQFSAAGSYTAGNGLTLSGGVFSIDYETVVGSGLTYSSETISIELDSNSALEVSINGIKVSETIAGDGLSMVSGVLDVQTNNGITIIGDEVVIDDNVIAGNGLTATNGVLDVQTNNGITIVNDEVVIDDNVIAGNGLTATNGVLDVNLGTGLAFSGDDIITSASYSLLTVDLTNLDVTLQAGVNSIQDALTAIDNKIIDIEGDYVDEIVAGNGLTGGGTAGIITLDVQTNNGITIVNDEVVIDDNVIAGNGLTATNGVLDVQVTNGLEIVNDFIQIDDNVIAGNGLTATNGVLGVQTNNGITIVNDEVVIDDNVIAGNGLTATNGVLDVQTNNGITIVNDEVVIDDNVIAGNGLTATNGVLGIDNTAPGTLRYTQTGLVFTNIFSIITVTHSLGTEFIQVIAYDQGTGDDVTLDIKRISDDAVNLSGRANPSITVDVIILG
jgi:hypothetical protein